MKKDHKYYSNEDQDIIDSFLSDKLTLEECLKFKERLSSDSGFKSQFLFELTLRESRNSKIRKQNFLNQIDNKSEFLEILGEKQFIDEYLKSKYTPRAYESFKSLSDNSSIPRTTDYKFLMETHTNGDAKDFLGVKKIIFTKPFFSVAAAIILILIYINWPFSNDFNMNMSAPNNQNSDDTMIDTLRMDSTYIDSISYN